MFTRLQLNILGRKNYIASVIQLAGQQTSSSGEIIMQDESEEQLSADGSDQEEDAQINRMYLTFSWWLLNKGWESLSQQVESAVLQVFGTTNPRADLSLAELSDLIGQVQYLIDYPESSTSPQEYVFFFFLCYFCQDFANSLVFSPSSFLPQSLSLML